MGRAGDVVSAYLYFDLASVPDPVVESAVRRIQRGSGSRAISFVGCPIAGIECDSGEIQMLFVRSEEIRAVLINWLMYWGIPFRVLP